MLLNLAAGDYRLELAPGLGGSIMRFDWRGMPLFRTARGLSILDVACFPLVPFSNRIAHGRFMAGDREVRLDPNFPGSDHPHTLHGFGWLSEWAVIAAQPHSAILKYSHVPGNWPWPYRSRQMIELGEEGLRMALSVVNLGDSPMPAGLGFHPFLPCNAATVYRGLHRAEWQTDAECIPVTCDRHPDAFDWWDGKPVQSRHVDTAYADREGPLWVVWPDRGVGLLIEPSADLGTTVVFVPPGGDFFCVEPVSHVTDAHNRSQGSELRWLAPGEAMTVELKASARSLDQEA